METIEILLMAAMVITAISGAATDVKYRKIFNWLTYPALTVGLVLQLIGYGWGEMFGQGLSASLAGAAFCLVVFGAFAYWKRAFGMGDVKLLAALGAQGGFLPTLHLVMFSAIVGAAMAMLWLFFGRGGLLRPDPDLPLPRVPYAVAIALGTLASLANRLGWITLF